MASTVQVERGQFGLVETWIMENAATIMFDTQGCCSTDWFCRWSGEYSGDQGS